MNLQIGNISIGPNKPSLIIAEAGVNHNGDVELALELVRAAKRIGADCIKFQTFKASRVVTKRAPKAIYQLLVTDQKESQFDMLKKLELSLDDYKSIVEECNKLRIQFLSTPYNEEDADFLYDLGVKAFKVASGQLVEHHFLKYLAKFDLPIILSTGMATLAEVYEAVNALREAGNNKLVVLQCTTNYPSRIEDSNIRCMNSMGDSLNVMVGYSDHVPNNYACYAAISLGAVIIEKHFTLANDMEGPDHSSSLNPNDFEVLINGIRNIESSLGTRIKSPSKVEIENTFGMRRSIVATKSLKAGHILSSEDLAMKRPMNGLPPKAIDQIVGKELLVDLEEDNALDYGSIRW